MSMKLLFVTWDGPGTTYHETLFIPLLERSVDPGDKVGLFQMSSSAEERVEHLSRLAAKKGMQFEHRKVPRGPSSWQLPFVLLSVLLRIARLLRRGQYDVLMARSTIPGGLAVMAHLLAVGRGRFIFDADGLSADEAIEFAGWPAYGSRYGFSRILERLATRHADVVLTRTQKSVDILGERAGVEAERFVVVINGKDPAEFAPASREQRRRTRADLDIPDACPLLVYAGSIGPQYEPAMMLRVLEALHEIGLPARLLMLIAESNHDRIRVLAGSRSLDYLTLRHACPDQVPALLAAADVGLAFRRPTFSQQAVAPIKVAEYLLCGLPIVYSSGVGDLDQQLTDEVGIAVSSHDEAEAMRVATWIANTLLPQWESRSRAARRVGLDRFSLEAGAATYREAFEVAGVR